MKSFGTVTEAVSVKYILGKETCKRFKRERKGDSEDDE
jgi:hypothetical protein